MLQCTIGTIRGVIRYLTSPIWSKWKVRHKNKNVTYISIAHPRHGQVVSAETYRQSFRRKSLFLAAPGMCRVAAFFRQVTGSKPR